MNLHTVKLLCLAALLCLLPAVAFAKMPEGVWRGSLQNGNKTVGVDATFSSQRVDVHFGGAYACRLRARFVKADGRDLIYNFEISDNGGAFCDGLLNASLQVTYADGDDNMNFAFLSSGNVGGGKWSGQLNQTAGP